MRAGIGLALLCLGAWAVGAGDTVSRSKHPIPIKIIGQEESGKTWVQATYPPLMSFRVISGTVPNKGTVELCTVVSLKHYTTETEAVNTISLHCEEGLVMELEGIDLAGGGQ